jgi:hypothetical protein
MTSIPELEARVAAAQAEVDAAQAALEEIQAELDEPLPHEPTLPVRLRLAQRRLQRATDALADTQAALDAALVLPDPTDGLHTDVPIALLPVRLETRYVTDADGPALLVRVYPDEIHIDDHEPELTDLELAAARDYWMRVWRAGRNDLPAERAAFVELCGRVGVTRALWVERATRPDDASRPADPTPDGTPLPIDPVLADAPRASTGFGRAAVTRVLPDRWTILGYRGRRQVLRVDGNPIPDPLVLGPPPDRGVTDPSGPPLDEASRWLVDFDAAVAVGMGIRCPLEVAGVPFDRLVVLGVRAGETPDASAARLRDLLDVQRYTSGLGFVPVGAPTNNTGGARSAWSRRPDGASAFDAARESASGAASRAAVTAAAFGLDVAALGGVVHAAAAHVPGAGELPVALFPATVGYFLGVLLDPLVGDESIEAVRDLFVNWVRPLGPLPTLRVGAQPYGLLPVTALGRWQPAPADPARLPRLAGLARRLQAEWLGPSMPAAARHVPHVGSAASAADPDQELLDILARDAVSGRYRLRPVRGFRVVQGETELLPAMRPDPSDIPEAVHRLFGGGGVFSRVTRFVYDPHTAGIRRALVLAGDLSEDEPLPPADGTDANYLTFLARRRERAGAFTGPGHDTLFFALARLSCALADAEAALQFTDPTEFATARAALEPELVDLDDVVTPTALRLLARPAADLAPQLSAHRTVAEFLATTNEAEIRQLNLPGVTKGFWHTTDVRRAFGELAGLSSAALDRLARATLDTCSHRLDAWLTAFATRRLADLRSAASAGVHLGGYGWVENLRPDPEPQPVLVLPAGETDPLVTDAGAGYVLAPSPTHASAAALLLSGHLSHRGASGPAAGLFAVDLHSDRARLALWLLDGVRQGQPLGALLGYLLERGLHERSRPGVELDMFIRPLRALAPLVADALRDVDSTVEAVESVAASSVVDGLRLLERFQQDANVLEPALVGASADQRGAVVAEVAALAESADALSDLLLAETTYQVAAGNVARAAASLDALGNGLAQPPEPEVTQTPRHGFAYRYRLITLVPSDGAVPDGWATGAHRPRRLAEPRLDAWVALLLGPADRIRAVFRDDAGDITQISVADLGLCALDLVLGGADVVGTAGAAGSVAVPGGSVAVHVGDPDFPTNFPADAIPLEDALTHAGWLRDAVGAARPLQAGDLLEPGAVIGSGVRGGELDARAAAAAAGYRDAAARLATDPDAALAALARYGLTGVDADAARAETNRVIARLDDLAGAAAGPEFADRLAVRTLRAIFGDDFPVLPIIDSPGTGWTDALAAAAVPAFLAGDPAAPVAWLQQVGRVRAPVERFLLATGGGPVAVAQHPPAPRWAGLPLPDGTDPVADATSILIHGPDASEPALAGLVIDEWADVIPARAATAGVAFEFDEPGARAPQAVLLAVPPVLGSRWTLDVLADVLVETADLARIRMVGPDEAPWLGHYLPALYVADNSDGETISIDLHPLVTEVAP